MSEAAVQPTTRDAYELLRRGALALAEVSSAGIRIDVDYLERTREEVGRKSAELAEKLRAASEYRLWRRRFGSSSNLASRDQLRQVLTKDLGVSPRVFTSGGEKWREDGGDEEDGEDRRKASMNNAFLASLGLPFADDYLRWTKLEKLRGTYLEGVRREVCGGFLHPQFHLHTVKTYRSCLVAETGVTVLENGTLAQRAIENVRPGDRVMGRGNPGRGGQNAYGRVKWAGLTKHAAGIVTAQFGGGMLVSGTPEHLVWTIDRGWVELGGLREGDKVLSCSIHALFNSWDERPWSWFEKSIFRRFDPPLPVYDLEIEDGEPEFFANGILVHNSSSLVNFQNQPIRDPEQGPTIRRAFVAREGRQLVEVDFSALEFKIGACFWKDEGLVAYASDPDKDIHRDEAARNYACKKSQVSKRMRYLAKNNFVFPMFYGSNFVKIARNLWENVGDECLKDSDVRVRDHLAARGITELGTCSYREPPEPGTFAAHVREVEGKFNARFPGFGEGKVRWWADYVRRGWFDLMTGFRVHGVYSRNFLMNCPIQGPGFHCLLWTLTETQREIRKRRMRTLLVGQIHDSQLADSPPEEVDDYLSLVKDIVERRLPAAWPWIIVPLGVEAEVAPVGGTWFDKKKVDL